MLVVLSNPPELARLRTAGMNNTSQDPDYEGPVGHEKKFHKTHFGVIRTLKGTSVQDDPDWEQIAPGRWRRIQKKRERRRTSAEVEDGNGG